MVRLMQSARCASSRKLLCMILNVVSHVTAHDSHVVCFVLHEESPALHLMLWGSQSSASYMACGSPQNGDKVLSGIPSPLATQMRTCWPAGLALVFFFFLSKMKSHPGTLIVNGESTMSLPVSRKEGGTVLEGSHLLKTPLPSLPKKSCRTLRGVGP